MRPYYEDSFATLYLADCRKALGQIECESVQCCVTSPPYWGLRDYGERGQIGLERNFLKYQATLVEIFSEVFRVLKPDGTLWLNLGDAYCGNGGQYGDAKSTLQGRKQSGSQGAKRFVKVGFKRKDLIGIPWRIAFALQEFGWYLRCDIIWHKKNVMPESVRDRPTRAHEYLFLLTKSQNYHYDAKAIMEPVSGTAHSRGAGVNPKAALPSANSRFSIDRDVQHANRKVKQNRSFSDAVKGLVFERNKRSVWEIAAAPSEGEHFAAFPEALVKPCILAGSQVGDTVMDPFAGTGTTQAVAKDFGRKSVGIELSKSYCDLAVKRLRQEVLNLGAA